MGCWYLGHIVAGRKTFEGRLFSDRLVKSLAGLDTNVLFYAVGHITTVECAVTSFAMYANLEEMLHGRFQLFLASEATSLDGAIEIYRNFHNFRKLEFARGVAPSSS